MAVSLYGLRWKIAAAALLKRGMRRAGETPVLRAGAESTGSYRGVAATLISQALSQDLRGPALAADPVGGLLPAPHPGPLPEPQQLRDAARRSDSAAAFVALGAAHRSFHGADFEASAQAYEEAFIRSPQDLRAVEGAVVSGARSHLDWERIWPVVESLRPRRGPLCAGTERGALLGRGPAALPGGARRLSTRSDGS